MAIATSSPNTFTGDGLRTVPEVAAYLAVSRSKVYQMMDEGVLPFVKLGGNRRIRSSDVEKLVADNLVGAK
jgi:excisionase family DNA binding protein